MMPLMVTDDELRSLYDISYDAITHEKGYKTWRDEKIAKGIVEITSETH